MQPSRHEELLAEKRQVWLRTRSPGLLVGRAGQREPQELSLIQVYNSSALVPLSSVDY